MQVTVQRAGTNAIAARMAQFEQTGITNEQIAEKLANMGAVVASMWVEYAALVKLAEQRGMDLSFFRGSMAMWVRRIAFCQVDPQLVAKHQHNMTLVTKAARLALPEQSKIASDEPVKVVISHDGNAVMVRPSLMNSDQMKQIFAKDHLRDEEEQIAYIRQQQGPKAPRSRSHSGIALEKRKGKKGITVTMANRFISVSELTEILNELV